MTRESPGSWFILIEMTVVAVMLKIHWFGLWVSQSFGFIKMFKILAIVLNWFLMVPGLFYELDFNEYRLTF